MIASSSCWQLEGFFGKVDAKAQRRNGAFIERQTLRLYALMERFAPVEPFEVASDAFSAKLAADLWSGLLFDRGNPFRIKRRHGWLARNEAHLHGITPPQLVEEFLAYPLRAPVTHGTPSAVWHRQFPGDEIRFAFILLFLSEIEDRRLSDGAGYAQRL